ncbi:DUF6941 family protein [Microbacterium halotolerans]|uniref:DUF6941 family protein n=1 Tax=Microbacterium halotolerans TaxID=246613 RepID=UPI000E6ACB20|nr:hypothetical protein [Microbacterium halotolerans]
MSEVAAASDISVVMADFANTDQGGKLNVVGGNVRVLGYEPMQGVTSRFAIAITITAPASVLPTDLAIEAALTSGGEVVELPGPAEPQAVRVAQTANLASNSTAPQPIRDHLGASHTIVLDFSAGLPLTPGGEYSWRVQIDGDREHEVNYRFAVLGPPAPPVFG